MGHARGCWAPVGNLTRRPANLLPYRFLGCVRAAEPLWTNRPHRSLIVGDSLSASLSNLTLPNLGIGGDTTLDLEGMPLWASKH